ARWLAGDAAAPLWVATVTALTAPTAAELALAQCQARLAELERDRDTAQSAQQESERRFQLITETVSDAFWIDDTVTRRPIYSSPGFEGVWGLPATIIEDGFEVLLETVHPDDRQHFWQNLELSFASSQPTSFDFRIIHPPTGHIRWLSERCFPLLTADGRPHQMIGITSDITPRKEAELALKQSEERFRLLADNIQDVFWLTDLTTGQNLYVNPAFERTWQLSQATLQQEPLAFLSRVHPDDRDRLATELQAHWQAAENFEVEYRLLLPDGTIRWMRDRGTVIFDAAGHPTKMAGIATDITAAHQAAATLQQYERIIAASPDPVCLVGRDYTYRLTNRAFRDWFVAGADPTGQAISTVFDPEFFTRISQPRIDRALQGETQVYEEWAYNPRQPSPQFISITYIPYYEADGTISGVISSARDLTALKQTRDRLAHTTERLQLHIQNSPLAVIEWDSHYRVQQWSAQAAAIFGWSAEEVMGRHFSEFPLFPATCLEGVYDHIETLLRSETHHQTVVSPNLTRDGQGLCCEWYNSALIDAAGNLVSVLSFVQDVTERHRTQAALKASEERWQLALLGSNEGIWDWQITTDELFYSPRWKGILGYGDDELSNTHEAWRSRVHPDDLALVNAAMRAHLTGQTAAYAVEYRMRHKSGDYVWILSRGRAIFDPPGHPVRFVGSHTDVSDRKHAELALRSSQQLLQLVFDNLPQRVFWKDLAGRFLGCNRAFAEDMGYCDPSEIVGKTDYDFDTLLTECVQGYREQDRQVIEADRPITFEEQIQRHQNGAQQWVSTTKLPLKTPQGELIGVFGSYEDISDRILARQSLQRYARMIEVAKDGICLLDRDYRYQIINRTYREWYGHNDQPILGQTVAEVLGTAAFDQRLRPLLDRCLQGETIRYASWFDFPHLGRRFRSITLTPYGEANGDITGIVTSIRDLTALKESESRQQELLEIIETTP
ncbi:MAG TPA: PAS domain S-box protein, partial [Candidatus Obscuribacterales bacterium]